MNSRTSQPHWSVAEQGAEVAVILARLALVSQLKAPAGHSGTSRPPRVCAPGGWAGCFRENSAMAAVSGTSAMPAEVRTVWAFERLPSSARAAALSSMSGESCLERPRCPLPLPIGTPNSSKTSCDSSRGLGTA
eukprot:1912786-Rhodomonas_salina.1